MTPITRRQTLGLLAATCTLPAPASATVATRLETVAERLENPWGLTFLPDGSMLVTERPGRLRHITPDGKVSMPVEGLPTVWPRGQGGLLDVALAPDFSISRTVFISYAEARDGGGATTLARGRLSADLRRLEDVTVLFRQQPAGRGGVHFGSRVVPAGDGTVFLTLGDRGEREKAQDLGTHYGKVIRIRPDGSVPTDNPFIGKSGAQPEIWSYGHRNIQGAALHPITGQLWTVEHGAMGGDELNRPLAGRNYGWPVITYGKDYSGATIGTGTQQTGMEQPLHYWDPSIAPSGLTFYTGSAFPGWRGSLLVGALAGSLVARLTLDGERIIGEERLLAGLGHRFRDVRQGPDGLIYLLTDARNGMLLRLRPA